MADRNDKYRQKYIADMSAHIGQPVETVGIFSRPGSMNSMFLGELSPLAGPRQDRRPARASSSATTSPDLGRAWR